MNRTQTNRFLIDALKDREYPNLGDNKNSEVNFIRLVNEIGDKKVSFVIRYEPPEKCYYLDESFRLCAVDEASLKEYYYGLSALQSVPEIGKAVKKGRFDDPKCLEGYMRELLQTPKRFFVDEIFVKRFENEKDKVATALFARTLWGISLHFGFRLKIDEGDFDKIEQIVKNISQGKRHFSLNKREGFLVIKGRPSANLLGELPLGYTYKEGVLSVVEKTDASKCSLNELYKEDNPVKIGKIGEYYSGIFPRLKEIEKNDEQFYNEKVDSYALKVERTSYAFTEGINLLSLNEEPMLAAYKGDLQKFDETERKVEKTLFDECQTAEADVLDKVNGYLKNSCNVQNVAVSTNVITKDGYLLYGLRAKGGIDEQSFYCSVNGQSELFDKNVEFYQESAYDDCPTIDIESGKRQDFTRELTRECKAELSLSDFENEFKYYGISILGIRNSLGERRVHFNVLAEHTTEKTAADVSERWKDSIEAYENNDVYGAKMQLVKSRRALLGACLKGFLGGVLKSKDILQTFSAALIGLLAFVGEAPPALEIVGIIFSVFAGVNILINFGEWLYNWIRQKRYFSWCWKVKGKGALEALYAKASKKLVKKADKNEKRRARKEKERVEKKSVLSPIAVIMTALYIRSLQRK